VPLARLALPTSCGAARSSLDQLCIAAGRAARGSPQGRSAIMSAGCSSEGGKGRLECSTRRGHVLDALLLPPGYNQPINVASRIRIAARGIYSPGRVAKQPTIRRSTISLPAPPPPVTKTLMPEARSRPSQLLLAPANAKKLTKSCGGSGGCVTRLGRGVELRNRAGCAARVSGACPIFGNTAPRSVTERRTTGGGHPCA
jgi:hypothetical protein